MMDDKQQQQADYQIAAQRRREDEIKQHQQRIAETQQALLDKNMSELYRFRQEEKREEEQDKTDG